MAITDIAFVGDVHGYLNHLSTSMEDAARNGIDTIIQVGDFWCYGEHELVKINRILDRIRSQFTIDMTIHFIDGNHEDYRVLNPHGPATHMIPDRLIYHPRGDVFTVHDVTIGCFGGAVSIDQELRREGYDWWANENPNDDDMTRAIDAFRDAKIDILVSHDVPEFALVQVYQGRRSNLYGSNVVRTKLDYLTMISGARLVVHGHWHYPAIGDYDGTRVVSLNRDTLPGHAVIIDGDEVHGLSRLGRVPFPPSETDLVPARSPRVAVRYT